jgi:hypothetical protein
MKLAMCANNERGFLQQVGFDKFSNELRIANEINKVLFHNTFYTFNAVRMQRDIMYRLKKFTEIAERRVTRHIER